MHGVPEFGFTLLEDLEAPKSPVIETFTEVRFKNADGKTVIPDGAIVCKRGKREWTCLVEVKTGSNDLKDDQVSSYLDVARENGFDGVLTISNQITAGVNESPVTLDGRKLRKVSLWHLCWWRILTEAVVRSRHRGVSDPDQAWILRELIHYLSSEASGTCGFEDMGEHWVTLRKAVGANTLRQNDKATRSVAERWEQFTQYLCLSLSQELGRAVQVTRTPRKQTTQEQNPDVLLNPQDPKREPKVFVLTLNRPMGQKRGRSEGSFVRDTSGQTIAFYRDLVQNLKAWQPPAPKIKPPVKLASSADGDEPLEEAWGEEPAATLSPPAEASTARLEEAPPADV
jgi:hypothetical protein